MPVVRGIIWIAVFTGIVYGVYFFSSRFREGENFEQVKGDLVNEISIIQGQASEKSGEVLRGVSDTAKGYMQDVTQNIFSSVGESIVRFGQNIIGEDAQKENDVNQVNQTKETEYVNDAVVSVVQEGFPVSTALLISPGELVTLFFQEGEFLVSWGEGEDESVVSDGTKTLQHTWTTPGTYIISIKDVNNDTVVYTLPVRIFEKS